MNLGAEEAFRVQLFKKSVQQGLISAAAARGHAASREGPLGGGPGGAIVKAPDLQRTRRAIPKAPQQAIQSPGETPREQRLPLSRRSAALTRGRAEV